MDEGGEGPGTSGGGNTLPVPKSPEKKKSKSSFSPKRLKKALLQGNASLSAGECQSQPSSPSLSGRLGRVSRLLSRSDANLPNAQGGKKRSRHDSGDSVVGYDGGGDEGSPSRGLMARAAGYVTHLKSRLGRHRDKSRGSDERVARDSSGSGAGGHHEHQRPHSQPLSCCGSKRYTEDSSDTLAGVAPGASSVPSMVESTISSTSNATTPAVGTVKGSSTNTSAPGTVTDGSISLNQQQPSTSAAAVAGVSQQAQQKRNTSLTDQQKSSGSGGGSGSKGESLGAASSSMISSFPFHTLNVNLLRGRNLVAKDACGSSDPYVKVKIGDKLHYKTKTIYRDLNPIWDESFVLPISDLSQPIVFKVFDYDWGFQDDFMGMTSLEPSRLPPNKATELTLTLTEKNLPGEDSMGEIYITVMLVPRTIEEKDIWFSGEGQGKLGDTRKLKNQTWSSVLTVLLLEAKNLSPGDEKVYMDAFVKFRMGNQKFKTRTLARTTYPKWVEQFDLYLYEGQPQILEVQVYDESFSKDYIGRCAIDIGLLEKEQTHQKTFQLQESPGEISMLLTISGTSGGESFSDLANYNPSEEQSRNLRNQFKITRSLHSLKDVGHLTVKVFEAQGLAAADIGGKSDPFCVLELVNSRLQTHTEYRTLTPVWNKVFTFEVRDVTSVLEFTVYDEDKNHKQEFLGKLDIPLYKIKNKEKKWYLLKDKNLLHVAKGNNPQILLEMELIWNPVRAGVRVLDPPETKFLLPDMRLKRETFLLNIDRLRKIAANAYDVAQFVESCLVWEYPLRSIIALIFYELLCYSFQPFMIPLFFMVLILKQWLVYALTGTPLLDEPDDDEVIEMDDDDDDEKDDDKKMSLRQKLQAVQDATQTVQNALGDIASICESGRNMFRMAVPFISWLAVLALFVATILLYFLPLRYLAMGWGFHKFFRPLLRPNMVPTNEVYNILLRVPDNPQLLQYRPLRMAAPSEQQQSRNRSPPARGRGGGGEDAASTSSGKTPQTKKKYKFW